MTESRGCEYCGTVGAHRCDVPIDPTMSTDVAQRELARARQRARVLEGPREYMSPEHGMVVRLDLEDVGHLVRAVMREGLAGETPLETVARLVREVRRGR
jgi:hypothetical protein